jgi:CO/xanthine dehydrogenase Mo-binding subunit
MSFAAHFAEVEVDTSTGIVYVTRYVAAHDSGLIVNRLTAESQVQGSVMMGLSLALYEELLIDRELGTVTNPSFLTYKIITHQNTPKIDVVFIETEDPYGPKPLGEIPVGPVAATISNAIFNATGARVKELPMTPERVLSAIEKVGSTPKAYQPSR